MGPADSRAVDIARSLASGWGFVPRIVHGLDGPGAREADGPLQSRSHASAIDYADLLVRGGVEAPLFALDLSGGAPGCQLCGEILERHGVPVVVTGAADDKAATGSRVVPAIVATECDLADAFRAFALDPAAPANPVFRNHQADLANTDRGWAYMWSFCKRLFETQDAEFA